MSNKPFSWIPTLYFAEGLPYVLVMTVSILMFKQLGISNTDIALYTGWLYLPWVIKPLWSPFIDIFKSKRWWILLTQFLIATGLAGIAFLIPTTNFFRWTLAIFWLLAFSSATHDISADGFYLLSLNSGEQSLYVGVRSTFYRIAMITGEGGLLMLCGLFEKKCGDATRAWSITFLIAAGLMLLIALYHCASLPHCETELSCRPTARYIWDELIETFASFFKKPDFFAGLLFILFYRLPEALLSVSTKLFLVDSPADGGLGLTTGDVGLIQGTIGVIALLAGGILGGIAISKKGLGYWIWPMILAISVPDVVYLVLSCFPTDNIAVVGALVGVEQFGYGFGFVAYTMYLMYFAQGEYRTSHYAFCTGLMALGMMLPRMISGIMQEFLGYRMFFAVVMLLCTVTIGVSSIIRFDADFGKKTKTA
ncbi:MAG: MFS transporter [Bacteroidaceae bacterium]|nr:MFS transporter [Bacteroidaceae bacterium]